MGIKKYFDREPVFVTLGVTAVLGWISTWAVARGLLSNTQASSLTQAVLPAVVAGVLIGLAVVIREFVTPVLKRVEPQVEGWVHRYAPELDVPLKTWVTDLNTALAEAEAHTPVEEGVDLGIAAGGAPAPESPVHPLQEEQGDTNTPDPMPQVPLDVSEALGSSVSDLPAAEPMNAGAQPNTIVLGSMAGTLGGLSS